jgi:hypothetical protein
MTSTEKFNNLLAEYFPLKANLNRINPILGALDDILKNIELTRSITIENTEETLLNIIENFGENGYISITRNIDILLEQIIWLNIILEKKLYTDNKTNFKSYYNYPTSKDIDFSHYIYILKELRNDEVIIFEYMPDKSPLLEVGIEDLIGVLKDLHKVKEELTGAELSTKKAPTLSPILKVRALINIYTDQPIFELTNKGNQYYNKFQNKTERTLSRGSDRKNTPHRKNIEEAIIYLKNNNNYNDAVTKAEDELEIFNSNCN